MKDREQCFLDKLWMLQDDLQLSNTEFADLLKVDRTLLDHTRSGRRRLAKTLLVAGCDQFPVLRELYFAPSMTTGNDTHADTNTEAVA